MGIRTVVRCDTLSELVSALCKDYTRRKEAIRQKRYSHRVSVEYKYINFKILEAAREIVGEDAELYIREIGNNVGYAKSDVNELSETAYKERKKEVKLNIAKRLHFTD